MIPTIDPATVGFEVGLREYIEIASAAGFKAIEFSIERARQEDPDQLIHLCQMRRITLAQFTCGIGVPSNLCISQQAFEEGLTAWRTSCEFAVRLGCRQASMLVNGAKGNAREPEVTRLQVTDIQQRLYQVCSIAQHFGIKVAVEFVDAHFLLQAKEIIQGTRDLGVSNLGVLLDTYGLHSVHEPLPYVRELLQEGLVSWVHLADAQGDFPLQTPGSGLQAQFTYGSQDLPTPLRKPRRVLPGQGQLPLQAVLRLLQQYGYDGHSSVEIYGGQLFPEVSPAIRARIAARALLEEEAFQPFFVCDGESKDGMV